MFSMPIDDVFYIKNRGVVVTGRVAPGILRVGDQVLVNGRAVMVDGIEKFRKKLDEATVGDTVGVLFTALTKDDFRQGDVLGGDPGGQGQSATFVL